MDQVLKVQLSDKSSDLYQRLEKACYNSARLYNFALYHARQEFFETGGLPDYNSIEKDVRSVKDNNGEYPYRKLPAGVAQDTLRYLGNAITSYKSAIYDYNIHPNKYKGEPKIPNYIRKDGLYQIYLGYGKSFSKKHTTKRKIVCLPFSKVPELKGITFNLPPELDSDYVTGIRVVPHHGIFDIEYIYQVEDVDLKPNNGRALAIDFGIDNFITTVDNTGATPFVVKGNVIKSINQHYNKSKAKAQSLLPKGVNTSKYITKLGLNRQNQLRDQFHKISSSLIEYCISSQINTIVIGYNEYWKQSISLGRKLNQKFTSIPYYKFKSMLRQKAQRIGINIVEVNEAYTSKCSFLDDETAERHESYLGKRISRGQFQSSTGVIINADVNAAANILVKAEFKLDTLPLKVNSFIPCSSKRNPIKATKVVKFGYSYS